MYQKCPVCDGTGLVSKPPYVAGDQDTWVSSDCGPYPCKCCNGSRIILSSPIVTQPNFDAGIPYFTRKGKGGKSK